MKLKMILLLLFCSAICLGQNYSSKVFDLHDQISDRGFDIENINGSIYILSAHRCNNFSVDCTSLTKFDEFGNIIWSNLYHWLDTGINSLTSSNDTLFIGGHGYVGLDNDSTIYIQMVDTLGNDLDSFSIQESSIYIQLETYGIISDNNDLILYGDVLFPDGISKKGFIHRIDKQGNLIQKQYFQDKDETILSDLFLDDLGNYVFNIRTKNQGDLEQRSIVHLNKDNNITFRYDFQPEFSLRQLEQLVRLKNGDHVILHDSIDTFSGLDIGPLIVNVSQSGEINWKYFLEFENSKFDIFNITQGPSEDIFVCGAILFLEEINYTAFILRLTKTGELVWYRNLNDSSVTGNFEVCSLSDVIETPNGDLIATGRFQNTDNSDVWLLRMDEFGCINEACDGIQVISPTQEITDPESIKVYPNPSDGIFNFEVDQNPSDLSICIFNTMGVLISKKDIPSYQSIFKVDLSDEINGVYFYVIRNSNGEILSSNSLIKI